MKKYVGEILFAVVHFVYLKGPSGLEVTRSHGDLWRICTEIATEIAGQLKLLSTYGMLA